MKRAPWFVTLGLQVCLSATIAGCAARSASVAAMDRNRIELRQATLTGSLATPSPTPMQAAGLSLDEPLAEPLAAGSRGLWPDSLTAAARQLQPEALRQGAIAIDRPSQDRLSVRIALNSAFSGHAVHPNPALAPFFSKMASTLQLHPDLCLTLAEDRVSQPKVSGRSSLALSERASRAMRPYPRAAAVRRALVERGVDIGRLAVELEPMSPKKEVLSLPSDIDADGSIALALYRCVG